jgi:ribosomal-protein-alanine N-acetyltransferase
MTTDPIDLDRFRPPLAVPTLRAAPLVLRPFVPEDAGRVRQASLDGRVTAASSLPPGCDDAAARAFIRRQHILAMEGHGYSFAIALMKEDGGDLGTAVGALGLWLRDIDRGRASVGYWLLESARGRGWAQQALEMATGFALGVLEIPRLDVIVEGPNPASSTTALRAGFRRRPTSCATALATKAERSAERFTLWRGDWAPTPDTRERPEPRFSRGVSPSTR